MIVILYPIMVILLLLLLLSLQLTVDANRPYRAMDDLHKDLLTKYEKDIRPSKIYDEPLNITFAFSLAQIIDVDEKNQIITTYTWINQNWIDSSLTWDPLKYDNITTFHVPNNKIWLPDIVLYNNADPQYKKSIFSTDVFVRADGNVTWLLAGMFKSSCEMNVRYYPFDEQVCVLKFASWSYDGSLVNLVGNKIRDDSNYVTNIEWELTCLTINEAFANFSCCPDENFPYINVTICIKRKPLFYVFNLILPCVLMTGMSLLGFHMPANSGEKVTLGTTTLLSITVSLMLIAENMPPTYETLPLIGTYYIATLLLVSLTNIFTMVTLNIHHKGEMGYPMPTFLKLLTFKYLAPLLFVKPEIIYFIRDDKIKWLKRTNATKNKGIACLLPHFSTHKMNECHIDTEKKNSTSKRYSISVIGSDPESSGISPRRVLQSASHTDSGNIDELSKRFLHVLKKLYFTIEKCELRQRSKARNDAIKQEWQQLSVVADRLLMIIFVVLTVAVIMIVMYQKELNIV